MACRLRRLRLLPHGPAFSMLAPDRSGVTCVGKFTFSDKLGGAGSLHCNDSATATIKFKRLSIFCGYGTGTSSRGAMSFTCGLKANKAKRYLKLPSGTVLRLNEKDLVLVKALKRH